MDTGNRSGDKRRGFYMALGSVLTLGVLLAVAIEGPKLIRGGAADAQEASAAAAPAPQAAADSSPASISTPNAAPAAKPAPSALLSNGPIQQPVPAQYAFRPAEAAPEVQGGPAPAPLPAAPPVTAATASPELKELRDRINRVAIRAAAAQAGVRSIEQGVQAQGLGLRGDIKAASIRLDYVLQEARASLQSGDVEGARNNLQYAEGTLQKLDKFLGQ